MNTLMLVVLAVVLLCYCGGKYCPKVLSSNKEMLLGVLVGVALCSFAGLKLEGLGGDKPPGSSVRTATGNPIYQIDTSGEPSTGVINRYDERKGVFVRDEQAIARQRRDEETNQRNMNIAPLTPLSGGG